MCCRRWHDWKPLPGLLCFLIAFTGPPFIGGFWLLLALDLWSQLTVKRMTITSMKAHGELTWEDSERDFLVALLSCTACLMLGLTLALESSCLPGQLRYIIHFLHAFDSDAVDLPLRPIANRFGGCFCLGSGPVFCVWLVFCCLLRCFRWRNASLAGGFAGRRLWCVCGFRLVVTSICLF